MAMKNFEKQLSEGLRTHEQPNAEQVQRTVVAVQNMAAKHPPRNHRSWLSFLIIQARFSGVSMWLWQILVLAALLGCMYSGALSAYPYVSLMGCGVAAIAADTCRMGKTAVVCSGLDEHRVGVSALLASQPDCSRISHRVCGCVCCIVVYLWCTALELDKKRRNGVWNCALTI